MPRGGRRPGAGRKAHARPTLEANKRTATEVLALTCRPIHQKDCKCELCTWWELLRAADQRLRFDVLKYLTDRRDGKPVQTVNHVHDKPIDVNLTVSLAETIQKARQRAMQK
jgi:hypothetical protein